MEYPDSRIGRHALRGRGFVKTIGTFGDSSDDYVDPKARAAHGFSAFNDGLHHHVVRNANRCGTEQDEHSSRFERTGLIARYHLIVSNPAAEAATGEQ